MASSSRPTGGGARVDRSPESYESLRARNEAAAILQSWEKLAWISAIRCESIQQTRMHFQNVVAGFTPQDEEDLVDLKPDIRPHPTNADPKSAASPKASGSGDKGKQRVGVERDMPHLSPRSRGQERVSSGRPSTSSARRHRKDASRRS